MAGSGSAHDELRYEATVGPDDAGLRADQFLSERARLATRSQVRQRLTTLLVNGATAKLARRLAAGDRLFAALAPEPPLELAAEPMPLAVLFEDGAVIVVDKPSGMVVHPGDGNRTGTLVNALLHHLSELRSAFPASARPGIVHRLDKDTSGVIIVAKTAAAHAFLADQFKARTVRKLYHAWVRGCPRPSSGRIDVPIARDPRQPLRFRANPDGGKRAITRYRVVQEGDGRALLALRPHTGRTHQLRVHLRWLGHPILGDPIYGGSARRAAPRLLLHASRLTIVLPGGEQPRRFAAQLPPAFVLDAPAADG